ncbi:MAG: ThuA domain-containing protein [Thermomicrobiales bacterium]
MKRAVIYSGADRYDGKYHDHAATSQRIAEILRDVDIDARIRGFRPRYITAADLDRADLVILNVANGLQGPDDADDAAWDAAWALIDGYVGRGGPLMVRHLSSAIFAQDAGWKHRIGGVWLPGTSMHPPISDATVTVKTDAHPIVAGMGDFPIYDEMYSFLQTDPAITVLATHTFEGTEHPLAWATEAAGNRVVYDAIGHGVEAFDAPGAIDLLQREARWLTGE